MPTITFQIENGESCCLEAEAGENLLTLARRGGVCIDAPCAGNGSCGKCRVRLLFGGAEAPRTRHIPPDHWQEGWRLACETAVTGDAVVFVPESAGAYRSGIRTAEVVDPAAYRSLLAELGEAGFVGRPPVFSLSLTLPVPTLEDTMPDNERLLRAVAGQTGAGEPELTLTALRHLAQTLRESDFSVRCVLERRGERLRVLDVLPAADAQPLCGLAVDIGTTTVSALLMDLESGNILARASAGNGQIRYGADVINRIIQSLRPGGGERLRRAVTEETLLPLTQALCRDAGVSITRIYRVCAAGNTTMSHLLLGLYADPVRREPFVPSFFHCAPLRAADVLPGLADCAGLTLAPNVGSYVGGDITAGLFAGGLWRWPELSLFIDLGTNGELVLGNEEFLLCCACSAGPAFEGGDISCGMRATEGAIDAVTINRATGEPSLSVLGGGKPLGLCGSGLIDLTAALFRAGIVDARGRFQGEGGRILRDEHGVGRYVLAWPGESGSGRELAVDEVDLDNFIRAKGAIFSAILLLLRQMELEPTELGQVLVAGGIGSGINFDNAVSIGMLPDVPRERFRYIGNSSLTGACAMLLSAEAEEKVEELGRSMTYVELSNEPRYMDEFVAACFLPHTDARLFPTAEV